MFINFRRVFSIIRDFLRELKYALQRAYRGYDDLDLFSLPSRFIQRMNWVLPVLRAKHLSHPYDMTPSEWDATLDNLIHEFYLADEHNFADYFTEKSGIDIFTNPYDVKAYCAELDSHRREALRLFVEHFYDLWD